MGETIARPQPLPSLENSSFLQRLLGPLWAWSWAGICWDSGARCLFVCSVYLDANVLMFNMGSEALDKMASQGW